MIGKLYSINPLSEPNAINKSIDAYNKAIEINPFLIKARIQLAYSYEGSGKMDQALNQYNEVLFYDPMNSVALKQIGIMSSHTNNCSTLNSIYERLLKLEPDYAEAYYRLGLCYININKGNARKYLDRYLDLEPDGEYSEIAKNMEKRI
jgi:tetratricopeptide (TPR) repeat protein